MTSRVGNNQNRISCAGKPRRGGFTLVELMLVMAMLASVLAVAAPSLARFFRGRNLNSEARRFLSLTRYGQSRAVSEGVPVILWIDSNHGVYGLEADTTYTEDDSKAVEYVLGDKLQIEVEMPIVENTSGQWWQGTSSANSLRSGNLMNTGRNSARDDSPQIRFTPDGFISETSPVRVLIREKQDKETIGVAQSRNRLNYEIQTGIQQTARR